MHGLRQFIERRREERGAALVWAAVAVPLLIIITATVTDFGMARVEKNRLQGTVDAAALAGVVELPDKSTAKDTAAAWAFDNLKIASYSTVGCGDGYDPGSSTCYEGNGQRVVVTNPYNGEVVGSHSASDLLHVETCKSVGTTFGRFLGVNSFEMCTEAVAVKEVDEPSSAGSCGLCLIGEGNITGLELTGSSSIAVNLGTVHTNSSAATSAIKSSSSGPLQSCDALDTSVAPPICTPSSAADAISMVGGHSLDPGDTNPYPPTSGADVITDPLAGIPYPTHVVPSEYNSWGQAKWGDTSRLCPASGDCWLEPGVYEQIEGGDGTIRLHPGIYVITGALKLGKTPVPGVASGEPGLPDVSLWGKEVMIYLACGAWPTPCADGGENGAEIVMSSGSGMFLTAPQSGSVDHWAGNSMDSWQGIVIMADRNNQKPQRMTGSGFMSIAGAAYFAKAPLLLTGSTSLGSAYSMIVAYTAKTTGSSTIIVNYDPSVLPDFLAGASQPGGLVK